MVHRKRLQILSLGLTFLLLGIPYAESGSSENQLFYYSDGSRVALVPASDWLAVRFDSAEPPDLHHRFPSSIDPSDETELTRDHLNLFRLRSDMSPQDRQALDSSIGTLSGVELVAPVFRSGAALLIVTDQFVARFVDDLSLARVQEINDRFGVEVVRQLRRSDRTFLLRVAEGDALAPANLYHELSTVLYAHPNFVRVLPPRPAELQSRDERLILATDGRILPSDTPIAKGRTDLRVIEKGEFQIPGSPRSEDLPENPEAVGRVTLKTEGFESAFPNEWILYGDPTWNDTSYRSYTGGYSGYCLGSGVVPPGPYLPNMNSWMVFGPFSLADAEDARLNLQAWVQTESFWDYLGVMASLNGAQFYGNTYSGDWAGSVGQEGWMNLSLDLKRVYSLGDLRGEAEVWIGIFLWSDASRNWEGVYVDDIVLEKITGGYQSLTTDDYDHLQWSLENTEQLWGVEDADIQAADAWSVSHGSDVITIAVLDEGVDLTHPDLAAKLVSGYDATDGGGSGGPSGDDAHGTNCAGIAAAVTDNSLGVAGIAWDAKIMPVRMGYGGGSGWITLDSWAADAVDWAVANGADVLSNSWGFGSPSSLLTDAIADARATGRGGLGAVVVFSSGNNNGPVGYPARLDTVLAVGALSPCDERKAPTSCDGEYAWGSDHGPELDLAAPGVHMYSTDIAGSAGYDSGDYFYDFNGTSSAAPVVAGVAALLLGQDPTMTATAVEDQLEATADDIGAPGWDPETGYGRVNAYRALVEPLASCYGLDLDHTGSGADPVAYPDRSPGCAMGRFHGGEVVTLTALPDAGWSVAGWTGTDDNASTSTVNRVTMPAAEHTATVQYAQIPCYELTLSHTGTGSDPAPAPLSSPACNGREYHHGEVVALTASPGPGWTVSGWSGTDNDSTIDPANTVTMPGTAHAAGVEYVAIPAGCYLLRRSHTGSGSDPIASPLNSPGCPAGTYTSAESITVTALPDSDWVVGRWTGTDRDSSCRNVNALDMPSRNFLVKAHYLTPMLVKDIFPGSGGAFDRTDGTSVDYTSPAFMGDTFYFVANDGVHGLELWASDGTPDGTHMVKNIRPGSDSAFPVGPSTFFKQTLTPMSGMLFFVADDGINNYELWRSDGTEAGTMMVKDIYDSWNVGPAELTPLGSTLFFTHADGVNGIELWKSDGTEAGTVMVKDIHPTGDSTPEELTAIGGMLFFNADDGVHGRELWKSDGTETGTVMVKDINPTGGSSPQELTLSGGLIFFTAWEPSSLGRELWRSDGTTAGTVLVKDISPGDRGSYPRWLVDFNGVLFFGASDDVVQVNHGDELWKSDGTEAGTVLVKDIIPGYGSSYPLWLTVVDQWLYFTANDWTDIDRNYELWKTNGSTAGTQKVKDIFVDPNPINYNPSQFSELGGTLLFVAEDGANGEELWHSNGFGSGTEMVSDLNPGWRPSEPLWPTISTKNRLFFRANDGVYGREIWTLTDPNATNLVFQDGYETADTSAWSSVVP